MKKLLSKVYSISSNINGLIALSRFCHYRVPVAGKVLSFIIDRAMMTIFGIDLRSFSVNVRSLSIAHPVGVMLGGNGVYSEGRVVIMGGVKFGGVSAKDPRYLEKHAVQRVFELGDNVVISTGAVLIGPLSICDNVIIGPLTLVNKSITEPGTYLGYPAKRMSSEVSYDWVEGMPVPPGKAK